LSDFLSRSINIKPYGTACFLLLFIGVKFVSHINAGIYVEGVPEEGNEKNV